MPAEMDCLESARWQTLLSSTDLSLDQRHRYEQHLETCVLCQEQLDRAAQADALVSLARQVGDPTLAPQDARLTDLMERLRESTQEEKLLSKDLFYLRPSARPGSLGLLGSYEIHGVIGQGGMGVVLDGFEPALGRRVAIKVPSALCAGRGPGSAQARTRFTREARSAALVIHDNVVTVHGVHEIDGLPFLVMQYIEGESLQARLDRAGPLPIEEVVRIGQQIATGLAAAHTRGLIHRDIKPANLLLESGTGRVKITDFGLARLEDDTGMTQDGVVAGTPEYMAPEQARGEAIDHRADLFSLGAVLYAACVGHPPLRGKTTLATLRQVVEVEPPSVQSLNASVPDWLATFIHRLLRKAPGERFQSTQEVAGLLEGYLAHLRQPRAIPAPALPGVRARRSRFPSRQLLGVAMFILGVLGLFAFVAEVPEAEPAAPPLRMLQGHTGPVHDVRYTPEGKLVSVSGWPHGDHSLRIWDPATGQELSKVLVAGEFHSMNLSEDGRFALAGLHTGVVLVIDLDTGAVVKRLPGHTAPVDWVGFGPGGEFVYSASNDGTARRWHLGTGKEVARVRVAGKSARGGAVLPDGKRLLTGDNEGMLQLWDIESKKEIKKIPLGGKWMINSLSLTPDGGQVLVACAAGLRVMDLATDKEVRSFQAEYEDAYAAALSGDGRLLTASFNGVIRLWNFQTGELVRELGRHDGFGFTVAFSPDGLTAASGGGGHCSGGGCQPGTDHDIRIWDLIGGTRPPRARGWLWLACSLLLVSGGAVLGLWRFTQQRMLATPGKQPARDEGPVKAEEPAKVAEPAKGVLSVPCPGCGKTIKAPARLAGKKGKCTQCGQPVVLPELP